MAEVPDNAKRILQEAKTIAVLGMKGADDENEPAYQIPQYLQQQGYTIVPVNPELAESGYPGAVASLGDLDRAPDVVEVFRRPDALGQHADELIALHPKAVWFQLGIRNDEVARRLEAEGIEVVQDRCMFKDHMALSQGS